MFMLEMLETFNSLAQNFDFIDSIYHSSLNDLYQFANDNVASITFYENNPQLEVKPISDHENAKNMSVFYSKRYWDIVETREKLESILVEMDNNLETIKNNKDNYQDYDQAVYSRLSDTFNRYNSKYNSSIGFHRIVSRNKQIRVKK